MSRFEKGGRATIQELRNQREVSHWRRWEREVDQILGWQTPAGQVRAARRAALFYELGQMGRDSVVLEVGCGTGEFTTRIAAHVRELITTDYSPELLDRARQRINRDCPKATVTSQDRTP